MFYDFTGLKSRKNISAHFIKLLFLKGLVLYASEILIKKSGDLKPPLFLKLKII